MTSSERTVPSYARFIPREELADFAVWTPDALGDTPSTRARVTVAAPAPAAAPVRTVDDVRAEIGAKIKSSRQAGYEDGYRDGLAALEAFKRTYASQVTAQIDAVVAALQLGLSGIEQHLADSVARTALALARQVVRHELASQPALVASVAQEAVSAIAASARQLRLRLHPDDLSLVQQGAADALAARQALLQADPTIHRGGCVVSSDLGSVDARIESRWAQAVAVFGQDAAWEAPPP